MARKSFPKASLTPANDPDGKTPWISPSKSFAEVFRNSSDYTLVGEGGRCLFCFGSTTRAKPYKSKRNKGMSTFCHQCLTRSFLNKAEAGLVAEAWREILDEPSTGEALIAMVMIKAEEIKRRTLSDGGY